MSRQDEFFQSLDDTLLSVEQKDRIIRAASAFALETAKEMTDRLILSMWTTKETLSTEKHVA